MTEERWLDGTSATIHTASFTYDADSRLLTAGDAQSDYTFSYDTLGRVIETVLTVGSLPAVTLAATYDAASHRTSLATTIGSQADALTSYSYDTLGRMTRIAQEDADALAGAAVREKRLDLAYNAAGQRVSSIRYEDLAGTELVALTTHDYDTAGRLVGLEHVQGATTLAGYTWTYDAAGRITQTVSADGTVDFTYDDTNQLTGADYSGQADEAYTYDANGNRTGTGHTTGDNNRLLSDGTYNYDYDAEGNRTRRTEIASGDYVEYTWDHRNRLTLVVFRDSLDVVLKQVAYEYDVFDRRITNRVDANGDNTFEREEHYVYDAADVGSTALDLPFRRPWTAHWTCQTDGGMCSSSTAQRNMRRMRFTYALIDLRVNPAAITGSGVTLTFDGENSAASWRPATSIKTRNATCRQEFSRV